MALKQYVILNKNYFSHKTAIIHEKALVGSETKIWQFCHIMNNSKVGNHCNIGQNVVIAPGVEIGNRVKIQNNVSVYTGVICEDDVFLGPSVVFTNVINPRSFVVRKDEFRQTYIEKGATLGANATIVCGNRIGKYAMIGAGAVVTKNVLPYALVVGNPAKQIGWVSKFGHRLSFNDSNEAFCQYSKQKYTLKEKILFVESI